MHAESQCDTTQVKHKTYNNVSSLRKPDSSTSINTGGAKNEEDASSGKRNIQFEKLLLQIHFMTISKFFNLSFKKIYF